MGYNSLWKKRDREKKRENPPQIAEHIKPRLNLEIR